MLSIVDLGSTNDRFVNGNRLTDQQAWRLNRGDKIHLGKLGLRISLTS
jgi:pSer/pThr/pTyr-binding forkhead associated (FHA) protein